MSMVNHKIVKPVNGTTEKRPRAVYDSIRRTFREGELTKTEVAWHCLGLGMETETDCKIVMKCLTGTMERFQNLFIKIAASLSTFIKEKCCSEYMDESEFYM